jgi:hypothetical protein
MYFYGSFRFSQLMHYLKALFYLFIVLFISTSCDKTLNVNAEWKDITIVYGLLDQNDSVQYIKITKAFLGEGDALTFSKIADSSNYKEKLEVTMEEWDKPTQYDSTLKNVYVFDTTTIYNKEAGDSIFYFPVQLVYKNKAYYQEHKNK